VRNTLHFLFFPSNKAGIALEPVELVAISSLLS